MPKKTKLKKTIRIILHLIVVFLLISIISKTDFKSVGKAIKSIPGQIIINCLLLQIVTQLLLSYQWYRLACKLNLNCSFSGIFISNCYENFFDAITPGAKVGGEAIRVLFLHNELKFSQTDSLSLLIMQKIFSITSFLSLILVSLLAFVGISDFFASNALRYLLIFIVFLIFVLILLFLFKNESLVKKINIYQEKISEKTLENNFSTKTTCDVVFRKTCDDKSEIGSSAESKNSSPKTFENHKDQSEVIFSAEANYSFLKSAIQFMNNLKEKIVTFLAKWLNNFNQHSKKLKTKPFEIALQFFLSFTIWLIYPLKLFILLGGFRSNINHISLTDFGTMSGFAANGGFSLNFLILIAVVFISYFVGMLPILPGGLAVFEGSMTGLLMMMHLPYKNSLAISLVFRFITYWFVMLLSGGGILLWKIQNQILKLKKPV